MTTSEARQLYNTEKAKRDERNAPKLAEMRAMYERIAHREREWKMGGRPKRPPTISDPADRLLGSLGEWKGEGR